MTAALIAASLAAQSSFAQPASSSEPKVVPIATTGAANLNISPRRVIFEGPKRTEAVYIFNQGSAAVTVDIALVDNIMLPTGEIVPARTAAERGDGGVAALARLNSARDLIIATPSRVTLAPGKGKTIRLRATAPDAAAPAGEYRTHLTATTLPPPSSGVTVDQAAGQGGELTFSINTVFGLSIPLIVRAGGPGATASLGAISLDHTTLPASGSEPEQTLAMLAVPLQRRGAASVYGNIEVRSGGRKGELIGLVRGIAVYPEIDQRIAKIPLMREPRHGEVLSVAFVADEAKAGGELAQETYTVP